MIENVKPEIAWGQMVVASNEGDIDAFKEVNSLHLF